MDYLYHIVIIALIYALFAQSLNLELGFTGLYNFGHIAFFGIGAYVSALLSLAGVPVFLSMLAGMAAAALAGRLLAIPTLRLSGDYFGIATLVFAEMVHLFLLNERALTRGPRGLPNIPRPPWIGTGADRLPLFMVLTALCVFITFALLYRITRMRIADRGRRGLVFIPQGINIFPNLTIVENLEIAATTLPYRKGLKRAIQAVLKRYPMLHAKQKNFARDLSGGERQILALSRSHLLKPDLVLLDEPSLGLAPMVVDMIFDEIIAIAARGSSVRLVEQNSRKALSISHRGYVLELGRNRLTDTGPELLASDEVQKLYLGG